MLGTLGIVRVCCASDAVRGKLARRLGGKPLLEWVVRRVTDSQRLNGVIVVLASTPEDHRLAELVPSDVPVFLGNQPDSLARVTAALERFPAEAAVSVNVAFPFVDPVLIDRLVSTAAQSQCDYLSYCVRGGQPAVLSPLGVYAEWFRVKSLRQANREARSTEDREQPTRFLYSHPEKFSLKLLPVPTELDRDDVRLTIDSEEDWDHAQAIFEALGPEHLDWQRIAGLLDHQPTLRKRMAAMNRAAI